MRILKVVSIPDVEVEIHISGVEAVEAILDHHEDDGWTPKQLVLLVLNHLIAFFKNLPDAAIGELNDVQRTMVADFLEAQALRFRQVGVTLAPIVRPEDQKVELS